MSRGGDGNHFATGNSQHLPPISIKGLEPFLLPSPSRQFDAQSQVAIQSWNGPGSMGFIQKVYRALGIEIDLF